MSKILCTEAANFPMCVSLKNYIVYESDLHLKNVSEIYLYIFLGISNSGDSRYLYSTSLQYGTGLIIDITILDHLGGDSII